MKKNVKVFDDGLLFFTGCRDRNECIENGLRLGLGEKCTNTDGGFSVAFTIGYVTGD